MPRSSFRPCPIPAVRRTLLAATIAALLCACGGGGAPGSPVSPVEPPPPCLALPAEAVWHDDAGASSEWKDVLVDGRNRIWLAGYDRAVLGQSNLEPGGNARGVVRQLSASGQQLFDSGVRFDSPGSDVVEALLLDTASGQLHAVGRTTGTLAGDGNRGQFDLFLARGDAAQPAAAWRIVQAGDERPQHPRRLARLAQGALIVAGHDDDYIPTNYVAAWADAFAWRFDPKAEAAPAPHAERSWSHRFAHPARNTVSALAVVGDQVFLGGAIEGGSLRGMFVQKLDPLGRAQWTARYSASGLDNVAALLPLPDGSLLMAGTVSGPFRGGLHLGQQDLVVARIAPADGAVQWSTQIGSAGSDWLADAKLDAQGNLWLFGETDGALVAGRSPAGGSDLFMLKLRPDGSLLRAWQWGTADEEIAGRMALDACGRAVAVGASATGLRRRALAWFPPGQ
jgi:hypothetical protein